MHGQSQSRWRLLSCFVGSLFIAEASLHDQLRENLKRCGYERPTPVQKWAVPVVTADRDLMACVAMLVHQGKNVGWTRHTGWSYVMSCVDKTKRET